MPVVIKASNNGFVDATKKLICLPSYLGLAGERREALRRAALATAAAAAMALSALPAHADIVTITDSNASATVNTGSSLGMDSLTVDGVDQLFQQWFWYRTAASGAASPINTLTQHSVSKPISEGGSEAENQMEVNYTGTYSAVVGTSVPFSIDVTYSVTGSPPSGAQLGEIIKIQNGPGSTASLPMTFIQYNDYDLNGTADGDTITLSGGTPPNTATQTKSGSTTTSLETVTTTLDLSHYQVEAGTSSTILNELGGSGFTTLSDGALSAGPGDAKWAWEWDVTIPANSTFTISKERDISGVPEPASAMIMLGGMSLWSLRRPRRAKSARAQRTT